MFLRVSIIISLFVLPVGLAAQDNPPEKKAPAKSNTRPSNKNQAKSEPYDKATVEEMSKCVTFDTAKGLIEVEMFPVTAPETVRNFLNLSAIGALNNTTFSRVVPNFVIQGGDLYTNKDITYELKVRANQRLVDEPNLVRHERGIVSMARGDEPNSASTHFFILVSKAPSLDNKFAAFGRVVKGMDIVDLINKMDVVDESPKEPVLISKVSIKTCDAVPESEVRQEEALKVNDLPRFGFRGQVKSVRESTFELKEKKKDWRNSDQHGIGESLTEFGEIGNYLRATFYKPDGSIAGVNTSESTIWGQEKGSEAKDFFKDQNGETLGQTHVVRTSPTSFTFESFDENMKMVRRGTTTTNETGRFVKQAYERFKDGKPDGSFVTTFTYDAYGFMTSRVQVDGSGATVFYNRFEYPELDDRANWIERLVFDSEDSDKPVQVVKREFVYFEEKN